MCHRGIRLLRQPPRPPAVQHDTLGVAVELQQRLVVIFLDEPVLIGFNDGSALSHVCDTAFVQIKVFTSISLFNLTPTVNTGQMTCGTNTVDVEAALSRFLCVVRMSCGGFRRSWSASSGLWWARTSTSPQRSRRAFRLITMMSRYNSNCE